MNKRFKLVIFDMDGTLLKGRAIVAFAEKKGLTSQLSAILQLPHQPYERSLEIAQLLKGLQYQELLNVFQKIPLQEHAETVVRILQDKQIKTALVTDGYQRFANDLKKRLGLDYAFANRLMIHDGIITGELLFQNKELKQNSDGRIYSINKQSILDFLCMILDISPNEVIAIGDGNVDIDMISAAGVGIAYRASPDVRNHADVTTDDLRLILQYFEG